MTNDQIKEVKMAWARGEVVQYKTVNGQWSDWGYSNKLELDEDHYEWRVKPKTIMINGREVPEPLRHCAFGEIYWLVSITEGNAFDSFVYRGEKWHENWLSIGLIHATAEAAKAHADALLSFTKGAA